MSARIVAAPPAAPSSDEQDRGHRSFRYSGGEIYGMAMAHRGTAPSVGLLIMSKNFTVTASMMPIATARAIARALQEAADHADPEMRETTEP